MSAAESNDMAPPGAVNPPLGPLPSGRHRFSREQVAHHQRERLIAGLAAVAAERGYPGATIGRIAAAAHVSRRVFYERFASKEECFLAAFDVVVNHLKELMAAAAAPYADDWPRRLIASLAACLDFFASEPALARLCMVEALGAGEPVAGRYREVLAGFAPALREGRPHQGSPRALPDTLEDSLLGSLSGAISRQLVLGEAGRLPALAPDFGEFLLTPYLGYEQARLLTRGMGEGASRGPLATGAAR